MESHIYQVSTSHDSPGIYIGNFCSAGSAGPDSFAQLRWIPNIGLELTMWSYDRTPIIRSSGDPTKINRDSCLACFLDVYPRYRYKGYLTLEINAVGTCRCTFGPSKRDRKPISAYGLDPPPVEITRCARDGGSCWMAKALISIDLIEKVYEIPCHLSPGCKMRANFYAYSENRKAPYWGSWSPILKPDLHLPEFFGLLEII